MPWYDSLLEEGYEPQGADVSRLSGMNKAMDVYQKRYMEEQKRRQEKLKNQFDMYKTLRESGYDPGRAHKSVIEMEFPKEAGGKSMQEEKGELDIQKTKLEIEKLKSGFNKDDLDLWQQAEDETLASLGGSQWMAIDESKQSSYLPAIKQRYLELKNTLGGKVEEPSGKKITPDLLLKARQKYPDRSEAEILSALKKKGYQ